MPRPLSEETRLWREKWKREHPDEERLRQERRPIAPFKNRLDRQAYEKSLLTRRETVPSQADLEARQQLLPLDYPEVIPTPTQPFIWGGGWGGFGARKRALEQRGLDLPGLLRTGERVAGTLLGGGIKTIIDPLGAFERRKQIVREMEEFKRRVGRPPGLRERIPLTQDVIDLPKGVFGATEIASNLLPIGGTVSTVKSVGRGARQIPNLVRNLLNRGARQTSEVVPETVTALQRITPRFTDPNAPRLPKFNRQWLQDVLGMPPEATRVFPPRGEWTDPSAPILPKFNEEWLRTAPWNLRGDLGVRTPRMQRAKAPGAGRPPAVPAATRAATTAVRAAPVTQAPTGLPVKDIPTVADNVQNIFNLQPPKPKVTMGDRLRNIVARTISGSSQRVAEITPEIRGMFAERARTKHIIQSQVNQFSALHGQSIKAAFNFDDAGGIPQLTGVNPAIEGAPGISDVAAHYGTYVDKLTPKQRQAMDALRTDLEPYSYIARQSDPGLGTRIDIQDDGFYIPRGDAKHLDELEAPSFIGGAKRLSSAAYRNTAKFQSEAVGIRKGYQYPSVNDRLNAFGNQVGKEAVKVQTDEYFRALRGPKEDGQLGRLLGETPKQALERNNPELLASMKNLRQRTSRLRNLSRSRGISVTVKLEEILDRFGRLSEDPTYEGGYDALFNTVNKLIREVDKGVASGLNQGQTLTEVMYELEKTKKLKNEIQRVYNPALKSARAPRGTAKIDLPGLEQVSFPDEMAAAANTLIKAERPPENVVAATNILHRGLNATGDNSGIGIQGLMGLYNNPKSWGRALNINMRAWADESVLGKFIYDFNRKAMSEGRMLATDWARYGLQIGGEATEFAFRGGIGRLPILKQANRAFGFFGDSLRLSWADDILLEEMKKGRTLEDIIESGDMKRIADVVNNMSGWSPNRTLEYRNIGDLVMFASRFFQSRMETLARGFGGLRPNAKIDQRVARRSILRMVALATMATYGLNAIQGRPTDPRPIVNGRVNPNFMKVRVLGRDVSFFGSFDTIPRLIMTTAAGAVGATDTLIKEMNKPVDARQKLESVTAGVFKELDPIFRSGRGLASGAVSMAWDNIQREDFLGRPVNFAADPIGWAAWLFRSFTPFATEEVPEAIGQITQGVREGSPAGLASGASTILLESTGAKSSPLGFTDVADDVARELGVSDFYRDAEPHERRKIRLDPRVEEMKNKGRSSKFFKDLEAITDNKNEKYQSEIAWINGPDFPGGLRAFRGGRQRTALVNAYYRFEREEHFERRGVERAHNRSFESNIRNEQDAALDEWHNLGEQAVDTNGRFDSSKLETIRQQFMENLRANKPELAEYVLRNIYHNLNDLPPEIIKALSETAEIAKDDTATKRLMRWFTASEDARVEHHNRTVSNLIEAR